MILYPAIDILGGQAVRLFKGDYDQSVTYSHKPHRVARDFEKQGARWLHCIDLDGARDGQSPNRNIIADLISQSRCQVQLGGGIRHHKDIAFWLEAGVSRVIMGTAALQEEQHFISCCQDFPQRIALSLDIRDGRLWTHGWQKPLQTSPLTWAKRAAEYGAAALIVTDIDRDGTLGGPNWSLTKRLAEATSLPVIISGGVGSLEDIAHVSSYPQISGIILGKALYERRFTLTAALSEVESGG